MAVRLDLRWIVGRTRPAAVLVLVGMLGACSGGGSDDQPVAVPGSDVPVSEVPVSDVPVSEVPVSDVPVSEVPVSVVPGPITTSDAAAEIDVGERIVVEGLTFVIPDVFDPDLVPRVDTANSDEATVKVLVHDEQGDEVGTILVATIRDQRGDLVTLSPGVADAVESLDDESRVGDPLVFVNGSGLREADGGYRFLGVTTQGTQLVEVAATPDADVESWDALTESVFVDGQSDVFFVPTCQVDVETISEVTVEGGGVVSSGEIVTASWLVRNSGTCPWTDRDGWVFSGGDPVTVVEISAVDQVEPGGEAEVTVSFTAPDGVGNYATQWQFLPGGRLDLVDTPIPVTFEVVAD